MSFEGDEYLYVLINRSLPGLVKIGRTDRTVGDRVRELSSHTGVPTEFQIFREFRVRDSVTAERAVHVRLKDYRVSENREFFTIEPEIAAEVIEELVGRAQAAVFNGETEDDLLARATTLAAQYGKLWPSMVGAMLHIPYAEAENIIGILKGRGMIDDAGKSTFSVPRQSVQEDSRFDESQPSDTDFPQPGQNYQFPPLSLLTEPNWDVPMDEEEHRQNAEMLLRLFGESGMEMTLGEIHVGPAFTRHEFIPGGQMRIERLAAIETRLVSELQLTGARILSSVPGKPVVGVEIPNKERRSVELREILQTEDWCSAKATLPIVLGKDVGGRPILQDLARLPHLLVAGAHGSGKRTCLNAIIASILYSKSPRDVRFIMVDPSMMELRIFNSLTHNIIPVVTDPQKVPAVLLWLLNEMQQRFKVFALVGVSSIAGFNSRQRNSPIASRGTDREIPDRLPHIVVVVNELADAMLVAGVETESLVVRLAQHAGTAGIHLIIGTQRPSPEVITEQIKVRLPGRIAFKIGSQLESRTVLGARGAEALTGRGDLFFMSPGTPQPLRIQGAFVSDEEIAQICGFLKRNGPPIWAMEVQQSIDRASATSEDAFDTEIDAGNDFGETEELFRQALEVLKATRRASTSMIQRRLRIGYNQAARLMEIMEEKGIVGPENGSLPREILVDLDRL